MKDLLLQRFQIISRKLTTALSALSAPPSFVSDVCFVSAVSFVSTYADKICGSVSRLFHRQLPPNELTDDAGLEKATWPELSYPISRSSRPISSIHPHRHR